MRDILLYIAKTWICACMCIGFFVGEAYAIFFANGQPTVYIDEVGYDTFYGGFDMSAGGAPNPYLGSTRITVRTSNSPRNLITDIYGGSMGSMLLPGIIQGDSLVELYNTSAATVYGGGYSDDLVNPAFPAIVTGKASVRLYNSQAHYVYGGGGTSGVGVHVGHTSVGSVDILIDNSRILTQLVGSAGSVGIQSQGRYAVYGDINIAIRNGSDVRRLIGTSHSSAHIKGSLFIDIEDSFVGEILCLHHARLDKDLQVRVGEKARVERLHLSGEGSLGGDVLFEVDSGIVDRMYLLQPGVVNSVEVDIKDGLVKELAVDDSIRPYAGRIENLKVDIEAGHVETLYGSVLHGSVGTFEIDLEAPGKIQQLIVGRFQGDPFGTVDDLRINLSGGTIDRIEHRGNGISHSTLRCMPGQQNIIQDISGPGAFTEVVVEQGAELRLGQEGALITLAADTMTLAGTIVLPEKAQITMHVDGAFVADGGCFDFEQQKDFSSDPLITFDGLVAQGITIKSPLTIQTADFYRYHLEQGAGIPIAKAVSAEFKRKDLFVGQIRDSLIWGDIHFDERTGVWSLTNLEVSKDYYGYGAGRKASSWLRGEAARSMHEHAAKVVLEKHKGLWVEGQGGYEIFPTQEGQSKMPWGMVSIGYDTFKPMKEALSGAYGVALGGGKGWNTWTDIQATKNRIQMGVGKVYGGLSYNGVYGIMGIQLSVSAVESDSPGFETKKKWTEVSPMGSLELGWRYAVGGGFTIVPRGKVLLEEIPESMFDFDIGGVKETVTLKRASNVTSIAGMGVTYAMNTLTGMDMEATGGIDWIRGLSGQYEVNSRIFDESFKESNTNNVVRISIGGEGVVGEGFRIGVRVFGDVLDATGIGGEATIAYVF